MKVFFKLVDWVFFVDSSTSTGSLRERIEEGQSIGTCSNC